MASGKENIERAVPNPGQVGDVDRGYAGRAAYSVSPAGGPDGVLVVGEDSVPADTVQTAFTGKAATSLTLKYFADAGDVGTTNPWIAFATNPLADTDVATPEFRRALPIGSEITIEFSASNPCTKLQYLAVGTAANTRLVWEYK